MHWCARQGRALDQHVLVHGHVQGGCTLLCEEVFPKKLLRSRTYVQAPQVAARRFATGSKALTPRTFRPGRRAARFQNRRRENKARRHSPAAGPCKELISD